MKPSEVTHRENTLDYISQYMTYNGRYQEISTVRLGEEYRDRNPRDYGKKEYRQVGVLPLLVPNPYNCSVSSFLGAQVVQRTTTLSRSRSAPWYYPEKGNFIERRESFGTDLTIPFWVWQFQNQLKIEASVNFLNKVNTRKVSVLEEAKNFKESFGTMAKSAERLVRYARKLFRDPWHFLDSALRGEKYMKGRGRSIAYENLRTYGDIWLEGRYHWLPTYMTFRDAFIGMQDLVPLFRVSHTEKNSVDFLDKSGFSTLLNQEVTYECTVNFKEGRGAWFTVDSQGLTKLRQYGVGSMPDLAAVAWELTPWSLVVDWVLPVSDILLAFKACDGLNDHHAWQSSKHSLDSMRMANLIIPPDKQTGDQLGTSLTTTRLIPGSDPELVSFNRTTKPVSNLSVQPFIAKEPLNLLRTIDSLAFLSGSPWGKKVVRGRT